MKQFDKWWLEYNKRLYNVSIKPQEVAPRKLAENGYRAALEMIQDWYKNAREGFDLGLYAMLKEELNGTSEKK